MDRFDTAPNRTAKTWPAAAALVLWLAACTPDSSATDTQEGGEVDPPAASTAPSETEVSESESSAPPPTPEEAGSAFLAENANREGVVTTASGLQYEVLASGDGATPGPTDIVTTHYHGTFVDGRVFDSSVQRGQPASFPVNRVIKGWTEALQLMKVGDKWRIYCPPDLAYGNEGRSGIPPDSTLVFEVELLGVQARVEPPADVPEPGSDPE